ncbi:MAG: hypothetical protein Q9169_003577 [Polycauliona sp. 2 TL-2023]
MATSISTSIIACLKLFNAFVDDLQHLDDEDPASLLIKPWQDELGRLRMWAANIGAHQTNQSSLDFRLRDSSHVRQQIIKLLDELTERLREARNESLNKGEVENAEDDDVESLEGSFSGDEEVQTDGQLLQRSVATIITCLFQMSMLVRKPAQHDLRLGSRVADVAAYEPFDYNHVRDKYPKADDFIVSRLGQGITQRRKYLKYRERHALKLKQGINAAAEVAVNDDGTTGIVFSETVVTDVQDWNVKFDDSASQSGISQTSYAPTLMSGGDITIPAPPRSSHRGTPFECPYCYFIITAPDTRSWNRHVFEDLQPYMCLDETCSTPQKFYATRREWVHHVNAVHRAYASPTTGCKNQTEVLDCMLCGESQKSRQNYDRHVARHLQEIALFVLPRNDEDLDIDEPDENSDKSGSSASASLDNVAPPHSDLVPWICCYCDGNGRWTKEGSNTPVPRSTTARLCPMCRHRRCRSCRTDDDYPALDPRLQEAVVDKNYAEDIAAAAAAAATEEAEKKAADKAAEEAETKAAEVPAAVPPPPLEEKKKPIRFKDAVGRKFSFPFNLCSTWDGMESLIRQAFLHVEVIGPHVAEGHYDLVGPDGEIILPQVWERVIEPDWTITMHMWPIPLPPPPDRPPPYPDTQYPTKLAKSESEVVQSADTKAHSKDASPERSDEDFKELLKRGSRLKTRWSDTREIEMEIEKETTHFGITDNSETRSESQKPVQQERDFPASTTRAALNEFWFDGDGIHRDVLQNELCKFLGPDALSRLASYKGKKGYIVTAVRPFTTSMVESLQSMSQDYERELLEMSSKGYKDVPYSFTIPSERQGVIDTYEQQAGYVPQRRYPEISSEQYPGEDSERYSDNGSPPGYFMHSEYTPRQAANIDSSRRFEKTRQSQESHPDNPELEGKEADHSDLERRREFQKAEFEGKKSEGERDQGESEKPRGFSQEDERKREIMVDEMDDRRHELDPNGIEPDSREELETMTEPHSNEKLQFVGHSLGGSIVKADPKAISQKKKEEDGSDTKDSDAASDSHPNSKPLPGSIENCENCETRFTVTNYSRTGPQGGLLCAVCSKLQMFQEKKDAKMANKKYVSSNEKLPQQE